MTLNVLVTMSFPEELLERVRAASPDVHLSYAPLKAKDPLPLSTLAETESCIPGQIYPDRKMHPACAGYSSTRQE